MSYIESHDELEGHPKTLDLMAALDVDVDTAVGRLHRFWWWVLKYAETGRLEKHPPARIDVKFGQGFVEAMKSAGFIDRELYRVHDWATWAGRYLTARYRTKQPLYVAGIFMDYGRRDDAARILASAVKAGAVTPSQSAAVLGGQPVPPADDVLPGIGQTQDGPRSDLGQPNSTQLNPSQPSSVNGSAPAGGTPPGREPEPWSPKSDRAKQASDVLSRCRRVRLKEPSVIEQWELAYPDVDLAAEISKCEAWAESNSVTRTPRGWTRTLNTWLAKEQDKTKGRGPDRRPASAMKTAAPGGKYDHV